MNLYYIMWNYINNQCQIFTDFYDNCYWWSVSSKFPGNSKFNEPIFEPQIQSTEM